MKFDKAMEIGYKILAVLTVISILFGVVSCSKHYSIKASAASISVSDKTAIENYLALARQRSFNIDLRYDDNDGNRSARLEIYGLQNLALQDQLKYYEELDFNSDNLPDTVSMGGTGFSGVYTSYRDSKKHFATSQFIVNDGVFVTSDEFNVQVSHVSHGYGGRFNSNSSPSSGGYSFTTLADPYNRSVSWTISDTNNYFTSSGSYSQSQNTTNGRYASFNGSSDSVLPANYLLSFSSSNSLNFGGIGVSYNLPTDNTDILTPWDYYNRKLLPYIYNNYDIDDIDNYLFFPGGYSPGFVPPSVVLPPVVGVGGAAGAVVFAPIFIGNGATLDLGGINLDVFAPIDSLLRIDDINLQFPLDYNNKKDVLLDGDQYSIDIDDSDNPSNTITIGGHTFHFLSNDSFTIDNSITILRNGDGTFTIDNIDYTLPIGTPTTVSTDINNYLPDYQIPTLENINIPDVEMEAPDLTLFAQPLGLLTSATSDFCHDLGLFPFIISVLTIGAVGYVIHRIGG